MLVKTRAGFTLLEMLIVIAIMGILMALGVPMLRPPSSYLFASDLKAMVQQARFESIKRNVPVAVVWSDSAKTFTTQSHTDYLKACDATGTEKLRVKSLTEYRNLRVTSAFQTGGLVWLPTGLGRQCTGGLMANGTTITDDRMVYRVCISSAGRVRIKKIETDVNC